MEDNSVKKYGGYYIGRYETGCDEERNSSSGGNIEQIAKIQLDLNVYNYITSDESVEVARREGGTVPFSLKIKKQVINIKKQNRL